MGKGFAVTGLFATLGVGIAMLLGGSLAGASSQDVFVGTCVFHGTATFSPPLTATPAHVQYDFASSTPPAGDSSNNTCTGKLNGAQGTYKVAAELTGGTTSGDELSCDGSEATGGSGAITFVDSGISFPITVTDLHGALTELALRTADRFGDNNAGEASFAKYVDTDPTSGTAAQCSGAGVKSLQFDAQFPNNDTIKSDMPAAPASTTGDSSSSSAPVPSDTSPPPSDQSQSPQATEQPSGQGAVKGERRSGHSKKKSGLKCGKRHAKKTKAQGKRCATRGQGRKKGFRTHP